jgi:dihydroorotase
MVSLIFAAYMEVMDTLIKQATVLDAASPWHQQTVDILIKNGQYADIAPHLEVTDVRVIDEAGAFISAGFTDVFAHFCDPGLEHKETLETGAAAAKSGGYTRVMVIPNTMPELHSKSQVEYIVQKSSHLPVQVIPIGALTRHCEGKELAEMYDMYQSGAVAFSDGLKPVQNSQVMLKALQYVKAFDGVVIQVPDDTQLSRTGLMHEGLVSTRLGLPGKPAIAETLLLARDIELLRYTGSRLHVTGISTAASVELIRRAKNDGLNITCSVTPYHLWFTDEDIASYDTNLKVNPPLRLSSDRQALREALLDGTIDCVASHHQPHEWDSKVCEFEYAQYGMEGLETCFAAVNALFEGIDPALLAAWFSYRPAALFGLGYSSIQKNNRANATLFHTGRRHIPTLGTLQSASSNNAFLEKALKGVIFETFCY